MDHEEILGKIANTDGLQPLYHPTGRLKKISGVTRAQVIEAFHHSFELIGGVPRLALWADANPSDFFKLYGRLLPASSTAELDGPQEVIVRHALPPPGNVTYGNEDNHPRLQAEGHLQELPRKEAEMGD